MGIAMLIGSSDVLASVRLLFFILESQSARNFAGILLLFAFFKSLMCFRIRSNSAILS